MQIAFYRDVLKLDETNPADHTSEAELHWVTFATGECTLALHSGGNRQFGGDTLRFVLLVDDLRAWRQQFLDQQVSVSEVRSPAPGIEVVDLADPEGNRFSLESVPLSQSH